MIEEKYNQNKCINMEWTRECNYQMQTCLSFDFQLNNVTSTKINQHLVNLWPRMCVLTWLYFSRKEFYQSQSTV